VDRDRIRRIGIDDDQIVDAIRFTRESQPRIADHGLQVRRAVLDVGEIFRIARGIDHRLIDLEEFPGLAGFRRASQRARAQPDHRDAQRRTLALAQRRDRLPDASIPVVVGDRLGPARSPGCRRRSGISAHRVSWCRASARDTGRVASPRSCGRRKSCARFPRVRRRTDRRGSAPTPPRRWRRFSSGLRSSRAPAAPRARRRRRSPRPGCRRSQCMVLPSE